VTFFFFGADVAVRVVRTTRSINGRSEQSFRSKSADLRGNWTRRESIRVRRRKSAGSVPFADILLTSPVWKLELLSQ